MEVLDKHVNLRRNIYRRYKTGFGKYDGIEFLDEPRDFFSNRWLTTILIDSEVLGLDREMIRQNLENDNIESRPLWKPMHQQPIFEKAPFYGNGNSERLFETGLCLPSGSNMTNKQYLRVEYKLKQILESVT